MADFESALKGIPKKIADAIEDLTSLEVVTYKGTIEITDAGKITNPFDSVMTSPPDGTPATAKTKLRIVACTHCDFDGDMKIYHDENIDSSEIEAHNKMVEAATKNRQAVIELFRNAIESAFK